MITRPAIQASFTAFLLMTGCPGTGSAPPPTQPPPGTDPARPLITSAECEAQNGQVVGDIGDGAIHQPGYLCAGGQPPIGTIKADDGGPIAIEGAVCCPAVTE